MKKEILCVVSSLLTVFSVAAIQSEETIADVTTGDKFQTVQSRIDCISTEYINALFDQTPQELSNDITIKEDAVLNDEANLAVMKAVDAWNPPQTQLLGEMMEDRIAGIRNAAKQIYTQTALTQAWTVTQDNDKLSQGILNLKNFEPETICPNCRQKGYVHSKNNLPGKKTMHCRKCNYKWVMDR